MKQRLDVRMVDEGRVTTRNRAQALIMAGKVEVNGRVVTKSGHMVGPDDVLNVSEPLPYVSRGGYKLAHALKSFHILPQGWQVIDVGASTGGFTDCWLQNGAAQVFAVDVGYGQLDWKLRRDPRVVVMERTNARYLTEQSLGAEAALDGASVDASFIGLKLLLAPLKPLLAPHASVVALVKPQFEAGPDNLGKSGVVRRPEVHERVLERVTAEAETMGYRVRGLVPSPIRGPEGNIEFLLHLGMGSLLPVPIDIASIVQQAWQMGDVDG
ncbi:MAG: TlyA family RNA methyltransferase [Firmicutes bacterium]|nr:TlyA family RNA methyltransferase [Bacillota bacterium]